MTANVDEGASRARSGWEMVIHLSWIDGRGLCINDQLRWVDWRRGCHIITDSWISSRAAFLVSWLPLYSSSRFLRHHRLQQQNEDQLTENPSLLMHPVGWRMKRQRKQIQSRAVERNSRRSEREGNWLPAFRIARVNKKNYPSPRSQLQEA